MMMQSPPSPVIAPSGVPAAIMPEESLSKRVLRLASSFGRTFHRRWNQSLWSRSRRFWLSGVLRSLP